MKKSNYRYMETVYGKFSDDRSEYVVKSPFPPRPWINYLSNGKFCSVISQTAGGFSFYLDPMENRVTRWRPEDYLTNRPGFYLYAKEDSKPAYSASFSPMNNTKFISARHGLGYTVLTTEKDGILYELTYFTPLEDSLTVCLVKMTNKSDKERKLTLFPFVEWLFGNYFMELQIRNISVLYNEGWFDKNLKSIIVHKFPVGNVESKYLSFLSCGLPVKGYDIDYEVFTGRYGDLTLPESVKNGRCSNSEARGKSMVGALECPVTVSARGEKEFSFFWGIAEKNMRDPKAAAEPGKLIKKYKNVTFCREELSRVRDYWKKLIPGNVKVETEDEGVDLMLNVWLKYQIIMNNHWGRSATFYHEGGGEFGYRNTTQDAWSIVPIDSAYAKERLKMIARCQRKSGQPLPGWSLEKGFSTHTPPADFPVWFPLLLNEYVKETGDSSILSRKEKYFDGGEDSIYRHAVNGLWFLQDRACGAHKIPLMGTQDWNDAFDRCGIGGKGESLWLGIGLCYALKNMEELAQHLGDGKIEKECRQRYESMKNNINRVGWDGEWYIYGFDDSGRPVGSSKNSEGKIQLNAQTWAIISGIADKDKIKKIYKSIDRYLDTEFGLLLFAPEYTKYHPNLGRISAFAPGTKENAAIFMHGCAFKIYADLILGNSERAFDTLKKIMPFNLDPEKQKSEPYILPEYRIGAGNKDMGEGAFTWLTGSADWLFMSLLNLMFGVKPEFEGLKINPCLPDAIKKVRVQRKFRNRNYDIRIEKQSGCDYVILCNGKTICPGEIV